ARASQPHAGPTAVVIAQLQAAKGTNGEYGADIFSDALAILGLRAAKQAVGPDAVTFLKDHQQADGGWSFAGDQYTDSNTTALVIQALLSDGVPSDDEAITHGFGYLQSAFGQGGFADTPGAAPDGNSDELAIQAIVAANLQVDQSWRSKLDQALTHLTGLQLGSGADAGAISNPYSKLFATTLAATHRAALVIQHGAGWPGPRVLWKCVEFAQQAISGLALLELAGVNSGQPPQVYNWGGGADTVCQLDRQPTPVPDRCFGPTSGPNWSDWYFAQSGWVARSTGVSGYTLHDGDIEGWTYTSAFGAPPPSTGFRQVCNVAVPPIAATHAASAPAAVRAAPTATAPPTATS